MALDSSSLLTAVANTVSTNAAYVALCTSWTSGSAGTEVSGGTPAYARKAITWAAGTAGTISGTVTFDVPSSVTVNAVNFFTASTGGTYMGGANISAFTSTGQTTLAVTCTFTES